MKLTTEVILCTYNGAAYIVEQLDSIIKQTVTVDKIKIYDDCSSDDTVIKINEFINNQHPAYQKLFSIFVNPINIGYASNFILGIKKSSEEILFLCDQDDIWEQNKVELYLMAFHEKSVDMVFSDGYIIDQHGNKIQKRRVLQSYGLNAKISSRFYNYSFFLLTKQNYINGAASAIRRNRAISALPLPCDMPHDYWLAIWCSLHEGIIAIEKNLWCYRQHENNTIGLGSSNFYYNLLGIWRNPRLPRERELRIWKAVTNRISNLPRQEELNYAHQKLKWLSSIIKHNGSKAALAIKIIKSIVDRSYVRFSPGGALFRDIFYLVKLKNEKS